MFYLPSVEIWYRLILTFKVDDVWLIQFLTHNISGTLVDFYTPFQQGLVLIQVINQLQDFFHSYLGTCNFVTLNLSHLVSIFGETFRKTCMMRDGRRKVSFLSSSPIVHIEQGLLIIELDFVSIKKILLHWDFFSILQFEFESWRREVSIQAVNLVGFWIVACEHSDSWNIDVAWIIFSSYLFDGITFLKLGIKLFQYSFHLNKLRAAIHIQKDTLSALFSCDLIPWPGLQIFNFLHDDLVES